VVSEISFERSDMSKQENNRNDDIDEISNEK
jgi:hypothetical protein